MNLDFSINRNGESDQLGQQLDYSARQVSDVKNTTSKFDDVSINMDGAEDDLREGLRESTTAYGQNVALTAATGAAGVVASTGINVGVGSTDQIIADNIAAAISLTGEEGLMNLANNLEGYTQQLTAMGLNAPEELVDIILSEIEAVLAKGGVIDAIKTSMQTTAGVVDLAKGGMQYAMSIATITANIQKLLLQLNKMQDADVTCIPSVKDSTSALTASFINQIIAQYNALKQQLIIFYNSMICTSNDSTLDNLVVSINNILEVSEPALDQVLQKYTGHTVSEVRNICNQGFAYIGMIQRAAAKKRKGKEGQTDIPDEEDNEQVDNEEVDEIDEQITNESENNESPNGTNEEQKDEEDEGTWEWSEDDAEDYTSMKYGENGIGD